MNRPFTWCKNYFGSRLFRFVTVHAFYERDGQTHFDRKTVRMQCIRIHQVKMEQETIGRRPKFPKRVQYELSIVEKRIRFQFVSWARISIA